jgi:hypothetical protein
MNLLLLKILAKEGLNKLIHKKRKRKKRQGMKISNRKTPIILKPRMKM